MATGQTDGRNTRIRKRKRVHGEGTRKKSLDSVAMKAASSTTDQSKNQ
jgi:hypothetical protein